MSMERFANLSIDLDNEWAYLKALNNPKWRGHPSYLSFVVPEILQFLKRRNLRVTVFVVARDAQFAHNSDSLAALAAAGHEIGNHSLKHDIWMHRYTEAEVDAELAEAEDLLKAATGRHPRGFRGPGFSLSENILKALTRREYKYDASSLPSFLGPVARAYYFATTRIDREQRERMERLFGGWREGLRPLKPYRYRVSEKRIVEIPVTTYPVLRLPIHFTYVMYLAGFSRHLARMYFDSALAFCRLRSIEPSILLHPLDFITGSERTSVASFPGMRLERKFKRAILEDCLDCLQSYWSVVSVEKHIELIAERGMLPERRWAT
jgi:peptidoglycan-N-acetylglucosamine deacetylase